MPRLLDPLAGVLRAIGRVGDSVFGHAGGMAILTARTVVDTVRGNVALRDFVDQAFAMGVQSLPLVLVTSILSGIVTSQQGGYQFTGSIPLYVLGSVVASSGVLELGPVMAAFVLIGRVGPHDRRPRPGVVPLRSAAVLAQLGPLLLGRQGDRLRLHHPGDLAAHGPH